MSKIFKYFVMSFFIFQSSIAEASEKADTLFETDEIIYDKNTGKFTTVGDVNFPVFLS